MVLRENKDIREAIEERRLRYWEVAGELKVAPETLTRWLRKPLTEEKRKAIETAIKGLSEK